ncbi:MAG: radical SAM protein [Myxococcales bacterium]|nr:radical SAM protein [Myxococcales bacterium]
MDGSKAAPRAATIAAHEEAAHEKRNWVRLTYRCNDRCVFCLDAHTHDGSDREREAIKAQILDGRAKGATRLILSGGEPTIHPDYVAFIRLGRAAGYAKIQTVTNGRMFAYPEFLRRCLDAGLSEITFSIHGSNPRIHDALVGTRGAFEQELQGLRNALADGRPIVNIDVCVSRGNVKDLPGILERFTAEGVREFDLLHVIPFGRAYTEGKETLFYDLEAMRPYLLEAFAWSRKPDMHVWLNRFPPQHLEGFEDLIQDPYKLGDEVRGRKEEYALLLDEGVPLDCRSPDRCRHCYLEPLCDTLDEVRQRLATRGFRRVRVDTSAEAPVVYGGDPASKKRSESRNQVEAEAAAAAVVLPREESAAGRKRLPLLRPTRPVYRPLPELVEAAGAHTLWVVGPELAAVDEVVERLPGPSRLELQLRDYAGLAAALEGDGRLRGRELVACRVAEVATAEALLELDASFEVRVELSTATEAWLRALDPVPARLALVQPTHERLTESAERDVDLPAFFAAFRHPVPVEGVPACILGRPPRVPPPTLDAAMLDDDGRLEIFRYARRYVLDRFMTKSLRCKPCIHDSSCEGLHINHVRAHGYGVVRPVTEAT